LSWVVPRPSDLPERVREEIEARLRELRPLVDEYEELLVAARALELEAGAAAPARTMTLGPRAARTVTPPPKSARTVTPPPKSASRARANKAVQGVDGPARPATKPERALRGAAAEAIVAALEHGSHTVSELTIVTAMSAPNIRGNLRRLLQADAVSQTKREGKTAYELGRH
jgi:DNA-binding transcriptional ArsR family regulator